MVKFKRSRLNVERKQMDKTPMIHDEPLYNIGIVAKVTGISIATLRAWERRYGFPEAKRTLGGHRLYSERDILRLKWVKRRIEEVMQTAQAICALRHQEQISRNAIEAASITKIDLKQEANFLSTLQYQLFEALIRHNIEESNQLLGRALALSSLETVLYEIIIPTLVTIGDSWEKGEISIATEHLASNFFRQQMLSWLWSAPTPRWIPPMVLACAPGEWHEFGLLILGVLLRQSRYPVIYLGQSVPLKDLSEFVEKTKPIMVILSASSDDTANS